MTGYIRISMGFQWDLTMKTDRFMRYYRWFNNKKCEFDEMLTSKNVEMVVVSSSIMGYNGWRVELQPKDVSHETCHCAMYPDKYTLPCFPLPAWHFPWGRHWQQAIRLFHAIPQSKVEPNLIAHNILIRCVGHRQWQSAVDLLMCQMRRHVSPDVVSYNSVTGWFQKDVFFVKFTWDEHVSHNFSFGA